MSETASLVVAAGLPAAMLALHADAAVTFMITEVACVNESGGVPESDE